MCGTRRVGDEAEDIVLDRLKFEELCLGCSGLGITVYFKNHTKF